MSAVSQVLQVRSSAGLYGAERMLLGLNHELNRAGIHSRLLPINNYLAPAQELHQEALRLGEESVLLPCRGRFDFRTVHALSSQIGDGKATLVHAHDYKSAFYALLATRGRNIPLVATVHGRVSTTKSLRLYGRLELSMLRRFDAVVSVSDAQVRELADARIPATRIHRIDNGIAFPAPPAPARTREELGLPASGYLFAAVGRLSPEKDVSTLIKAFAVAAKAHPNALLVVVGDGPERGMLEEMVREIGLSHRIHFLGVRTDMERIYPIIDCIVLASLSEGMPLVVLEAMACALPVIATRVGQVPALLANSEHGILVAPGDAEGLAQALLARLATPDLHDERALAHVRSRHSARAMSMRYRDLYRELLEEARG